MIYRNLKRVGILITLDHPDMTVSGSPNILFYLPERSGGEDNLQEVTQAKIFEMEQRHAVDDEENGYKDYFHYVMENESLQYPTNAEQAFNTFQKLMSIALPS